MTTPREFKGFKVGDRVMHSFSFVKSMSSYADYSKRRGTIVELPPEGSQSTNIKIDWDDAKPGSFPYNSANNITHAKGRGSRKKI